MNVSPPNETLTSSPNPQDGVHGLDLAVKMYLSLIREGVAGKDIEHMEKVQRKYHRYYGDNTKQRFLLIFKHIIHLRTNYKSVIIFYHGK